MQSKPEAIRGDLSSSTLPSLEWSPLFAGVAPWSSAIGAACADMSGQHLDFLRRRWIEDLQLPVRLASCKNPSELMQAYQAFLVKAAQDYRDEYVALAHIGRRALSPALPGTKSDEEEEEAVATEAAPAPAPK